MGLVSFYFQRGGNSLFVRFVRGTFGAHSNRPDDIPGVSLFDEDWRKPAMKALALVGRCRGPICERWHVVDLGSQSRRN